VIHCHAPSSPHAAARSTLPLAAAPRAPVRVRPLAFADYDALVPALTALLCDAVQHGAFLGFVAPLAPHEARAYWHGLRAELQLGTRLLFVAWSAQTPIGCAQLALAPWPNARHRAEINKLFVAPALRGLGVGGALLDAMHEAALRLERTLVVLGTQQGGAPVAFYKRHGYREAGVIPGYMSDAAGVRHGNVQMYRELAATGARA